MKQQPALDTAKRLRSIGTLLLIASTASPAEAQLVAEGRQWIPGFEPDQRTGEALAICDFDGDGIDDLAIGLPDTDLGAGSLLNAGTVRVYYGDDSGVLGQRLQELFLEDLPSGQNGAGNRFGAALAAADFNLDGACDLAIGIPGLEVSGAVAAGRVAVISGEAGDILDRLSTDYFDQSVLTGTPETGDRFGSVLAAGPLGGEDPYPDLVVGVPRDRVGAFQEAGAVHIIFALNDGGLDTFREARLHQDVEDLFGIAGPGDRFGAALAIGEVTGDEQTDLIVGTPGDRIDLTDGAGSVQVIPGGGDGVDINIATQQFLSQDVEDVLGDVAEGDGFGSAIALGEFNGGGGLDLAIGVPGDAQFGPNQSGIVQVFFGTLDGGFSLEGEQILFESLISPEVATFDRFGTTLASADFNGDGRDDLAIGYPLDNVFGVVNAGNVAVLYGAPSGLATSDAQLWNGFTLLSLEPGDETGFALAAGRLGGERRGPYLAIGIPGREGDGLMQQQMGGAMLLQGQLLVFSDDFERGNTTAWSSTTP
ncbi:MAG: FG-GAP repeat protein [Acidobacteriota bacterium]